MLALKICLISIILFFVFRSIARASLTDIDRTSIRYTGTVHNLTPMMFLLLAVLCLLIAVISGISSIILLI